MVVARVRHIGAKRDVRQMSDKGPVTKGRRFLKLAGMTASVAGTYAGSKLRSAFRSPTQRDATRIETNRDIGERIAKTLGELKGAAMKLGQMASIGADVLPKEIATALKVLQKEAPPVPFDVISRMIESELGSPPEVLYRTFDKEPFASASIGQVHRAVTDDGREVVVKVQYPGVGASVDSDLAHLKMALRAGGLLKLNRKSVNSVFEEVRVHLHEELDYCNEADNVRLFGEHHESHDFVHVPEVVGERSAQRVLTLTYLAGDDISVLDERGYSQDVRNAIGCNLYRMIASQIFELTAIHADPNPANFAFRPDGSIVLYDFGCVKKMKPTIVDAIARTLRGSLFEDYDLVEQGLIELGVRTIDGPPVEVAFYKDWRDVFLRPFLCEGAFDYGQACIHEEVIKRIPSMMKRLDSFQPASEIIFLDRVLGGHYGNLRTVRSRGKFLDAVWPYLDVSPSDASPC